MFSMLWIDVHSIKNLLFDLIWKRETKTHKKRKRFSSLFFFQFDQNRIICRHVIWRLRRHFTETNKSHNTWPNLCLLTSMSNKKSQYLAKSRSSLCQRTIVRSAHREKLDKIFLLLLLSNVKVDSITDISNSNICVICLRRSSSFSSSSTKRCFHNAPSSTLDFTI